MVQSRGFNEKKYWLLLLILLVVSNDRLCAATKIQMTEAETHWLKSHNEVTIGTGFAWVPFDLVKPDGEYVGLNADYLRLISDRSGINFKLIHQSRKKSVSEAMAHKIDALNGASITQERQKTMLFSHTFFTAPNALYVKRLPQ